MVRGSARRSSLRALHRDAALLVETLRDNEALQDGEPRHDEALLGEALHNDAPVRIEPLNGEALLGEVRHADEVLQDEALHGAAPAGRRTP